MLFESASGFALFDIKGLDEIGQAVDKVQASVSDMQRFGKVAKLTAFKPFASAADALEQINAVSEANLTDELKNFISMNLPKVRVDAVLGVCGRVGLMRGHTIQQQQPGGEGGGKEWQVNHHEGSWRMHICLHLPPLALQQRVCTCWDCCCRRGNWPTDS